MRKAVITMFLVAMIFAIFGCSAQDKSLDAEDKLDVENLGKLQSFSYFYGSYHGGYWDYKFSRTEEGEILFTAEGLNGVKLDISTTVEQEVLDGLVAILAEQDIYEWNGMSQSDSVVDGWGFSLKAEFENETLKAGATTVASINENYVAGHTALKEHLWQLAESLK